jgi:hypothetical protein
MTYQELASEIAFLEGKKDEEAVGNVREQLTILSDLLFKDVSIFVTLYENGKRRAELKKNE